MWQRKGRTGFSSLAHKLEMKMSSPAVNAFPAMTGRHKLPEIGTSLNAIQALDQESEDFHAVPGSAAD